MLRSIMFMTSFVSSIPMMYSIFEAINPLFGMNNFAINVIVGSLATGSMAWE